jgi:hypothetical protein
VSLRIQKAVELWLPDDPHVTPSLTRSETSEPLKEALLVIRVSTYDARDDGLPRDVYAKHCVRSVVLHDE